jgi:hypothetical protein
MLSAQQKETVLQKILTEPKVPAILKRRLGRIMFPVLINEVDVLLSGVLPPAIQELINSAADGLTPEETAHLSQVLVAYALEKIKNPILQSALAIVLPIIVDTIIDALTQGKSL